MIYHIVESQQFQFKYNTDREGTYVVRLSNFIQVSTKCINYNLNV